MKKNYTKNRSFGLVLFFVSLWIVIIGRLFQLQIIKPTIDITTTKKIIPAFRGNIFDRNGKPFTDNTFRYSIAVNPKSVLNRTLIVDIMKSVFSADSQKVMNTLHKDLSFVYLARNFSEQKNNRLNEFLSDVQGVIFEKNNFRLYPI